jgi:hypothetical protein
LNKKAKVGGWPSASVAIATDSEIILVASTSKAAADSSSKANELLNEQVRELENAMLVLEDELAEENLDRDMASNASARKIEFNADFNAD